VREQEQEQEQEQTGGRAQRVEVTSSGRFREYARL